VTIPASQISSIPAKPITYAYTPPSVKMPQGEQRKLRLTGRRVIYGQAFSLTTEIAAIVTPLAARIAAEPEPGPVLCRDDVQALADAVHAVVSAVVGRIAESEAQRKTAGVAPENRARASKLIRDMAQRPPAPTITDEALTDGSWSAALVELASPFSDGLSKLLGRSNPPGAVTGGQRSRSELLVAELREVDVAAVALAKRLAWAAVCREEYQKVQELRAERDPEVQARKELAQMGIDA
jgi:hypothetical protein